VYHTDTAAMSLLVGILGQSRTSRLTLTLRDRLGLVQTISSGYTAMEAGGLVTVTAQLDPAQLTRVESEILREVERLRDHGVTEEERRRAVTAAEAGHEFSLETAEGRAFALGRAETMWSIEAELAWVDRLRSVTPVEVRSVARRYLVPGAHVRLAVVPPR
jgi:zinc protease